MNRSRSLLLHVLPLALFTGCLDEYADDTNADEVSARTLAPPAMHRISGGNLASLVLRSDGTLASSGDNSSGQLGDGTTTDRHAPVRVPGLAEVTMVSAGPSDYSLARTADGKLWSFGSQLWGQLGDGSGSDQPAPVQVKLLSGVTTAAAANLHGLAVTSDGVTPDGTVWAWGINGSGQLGDGTNLQRKTPVRVSGLADATAVAGGTGHSLALRSDGTVWAWGRNSEGQLGDGTLHNRTTPVQVSELANVTAIAAGPLSSYALRSDGTVVAWGDTTSQTSCPPAVDPTLPAQLAGLTDIAALAAGDNMLALKQDGTVLAWGRNAHGELGDGTTHERCTPVPVSGLAGVTAVAVGKAHSLAQTENGRVFAFGSNNHGQLGDGDDLGTNRKRPVPTRFNGGADCPACASWPMPNSASSESPHPASYTQVTDHVVDDVTGLEWQQSAGCTAGCTQAAANAYCAGLTLAGHDDWRLPTRIELISLVDATQHNPAIDPDAFPDASIGYFWSSTPMLLYPDNGFRIGGSEGDTASGKISGLGPARCVRAPAGAPASDYELHAAGTPAGTVVDTGTWLTWQQTASPATYTWSDAIDYCHDNVAGLPGAGWRLPSMKELQTLVDDTQVSPAIDEAAFPNTPSGGFWSATPVAWFPGTAWYVRFDLGHSNHAAVGAGTFHVRCVQ